MKQELEQIVKPIVKWYQEQKKILPWKQDKEPYHIWISEIMLQQTRIEAVKKYYTRFMKELPTIQHLAKVSDEKLLKLWEGLGYYNRAKNLKKAAIQIEENYKGQMPTSYAELLNLSGIGEYTAGAIASISYQEKVPAVDGNVLRVVSRVIASKDDVLLPETKKRITKKLLEIMPDESGDFNEGLMELGEKICLPNTIPLCEKCPIQQFCIANKENLTNEIPVRIKKQKRKIEKRTVFIVKYKDEIAIRKREKTGILANLYEFPNVVRRSSRRGSPSNFKKMEYTIKKFAGKKACKAYIYTYRMGYACL